MGCYTAALLRRPTLLDVAGTVFFYVYVFFCMSFVGVFDGRGEVFCGVFCYQRLLVAFVVVCWLLLFCFFSGDGMSSLLLARAHHAPAVSQ